MQECDLGLCEFVGYFHVFPSSYLRLHKGPAVPKRHQQKMNRKSLYTALVIRTTIRGMAFANGQGIVACLPFPVNSHSHSHSLKIPWGEGGFGRNGTGGPK